MTDMQQPEGGQPQPLDRQERTTKVMPVESQAPPIYQVRMQPPEPVRPSGPSLPTIIFGALVGLLALTMLALGLVFLRYGTDLTIVIPWQRIIPLIFAALGVVLIGASVLAWLASARRTRSVSKDQDIPEDQAAKDGQRPQQGQGQGQPVASPGNSWLAVRSAEDRGQGARQEQDEYQTQDGQQGPA